MCSFRSDAESKIVLYAPTFRSIHDLSIKPYSIDWSRVKGALCKALGTERVSIIVRLHPNLMGRVDTSPLIAFEDVYDGTKYHDMQELLSASDMLITDYSSSMFDFSMMGKPCLLYAIDVAQYDRGYYFDIHNLPYPLAESEDELLEILERFDHATYSAKLKAFMEEKVGVLERGTASADIVRWMREHSIQ